MFMEALFIDPSIETSQKDIFAEQFCPLYFNDEQYRNDNDGSYIFIEDGRIKGIVKSIKIDSSRLTSKHFIKIGELDTNYGYCRKSYDLPIHKFQHKMKIFLLMLIEKYHL